MESNDRKFWIDVGGTFTDCLTIDPDGKERKIKVLSSGTVKGTGYVKDDSSSLCQLDITVPVNGFWDAVRIEFLDMSGNVTFRSSVQESMGKSNSFFLLSDQVPTELQGKVAFQLITDIPSPMMAIHQLTSTPIREQLPKCEVYLGTTKGTNALLTRSGSRTALLTSAGLQDFLTIGDQTRQNLFELVATKAAPLFETAIEIDERILFDGTVEKTPDRAKVLEQLVELKSRGIEALAICFIHAFRFDQHERMVGAIAVELGFNEVRLSSEVAPLIQLVSRAETTVLDAYLNPIISSYLDDLKTYLGPESSLKLMTSSGALTTRELFTGKDSVLSGPAAGAVGSARVAEQIGHQRSIGFDMGGTSTDVSRYDGEFQIDYESRKAGVRILSPMMSVETVAAGGGSVCRFEGTRFLVGPESAGSTPGPACYGFGGPLTVTDINLFLGRLDTRQFPFELDRDAVHGQLSIIQEALMELGQRKSLTEIAEGFLEVANQNMAMAIKNVSAARGIDPREYLLVSFGGAGGQHCCGVADCLGISKILVHPNSSILSAVGIRLSDQSLSGARSVLKNLSIDSEQEVLRIANDVANELMKKIDGSPTDVVIELSVDLRYVGTDACINISLTSGVLHELFESAHLQYYGYVQKAREIEVVAVRANVIQPGVRLKPRVHPQENRLTTANDNSQIHVDGSEVEAGAFDWNELESGMQIQGPAVIASPYTSAVIDPGWKVLVLKEQQLLLQRDETEETTRALKQDLSTADPVQLELFNGQFQSIAEQMGHILKNTSISVNVKQRMDFSCAIFSETGDLVVNAPHIPVHLGAMSESVKATIRLNPEISRGDVFITNDPYEGGSHLPDVTVLTPVFIESNRPLFWVASRAHHAEIGGMAPGSMPSNATKLEQEGVVIRNLRLIRAGQSGFDELEDVLKNATYPSRNISENLADVAAQVAANQAGVNCLIALTREKSLQRVQAYMNHIKTAAELKARAFIRTLPDAKMRFEDSMDDQSRICVEIEIRGDEMVVDFAGTSPIHAGNLNANRAIVSSAIMYVMRCLIRQEIPLNQGILAPIEIRLPECFLNPDPRSPHGESPAVVGGNVETSQRIVDVVFGAFGAVAASQGTMNNWLVGDDSFGYYETVGGGSGASHSKSGASAVHCHMSNTRLTDPEIMETRYPMILRDFRIRRSSGGEGVNSGGDGMVREVEFSKNLTLSLLTSRRHTRPFGLDGGQPGKLGENWLTRNSGERELLPSQCQIEVYPGDRLRLLTPGGGGFGRPIR